MKLRTLLMTLALAGIAHAEQKFPRGTFESKDLDKAKAEAVASKKPLAFVMTDKDTTCPLCQNATSEFLDVVKSKTVVVYVSTAGSTSDWNGVWNALPEAAKKGLKAGEKFPKVAVTDAAAANLITSIDYDTHITNDKALREFKKALKPAK